MPNIDTTAIEGFEGMTAEQKVEALLKFEIPENVDLSGFVPKHQFDKAASDLAEAKKQLKSRMTEDEAAKEKATQELTDIQEKYNELLKTSTIANHTARYMAMPGYDEKLARDTAEALFNGDMDKVFENQKKANSAYERQLKADAMRGMKSPQGGENGSVSDAVKIAQRLGKERAAENKAANDAMKHYM